MSSEKYPNGRVIQTLYFDVKERKEVSEYCRKQMVPVSWMIRKIVLEYIRKGK